VPVALWVALGLGHLAGAATPIPAHLEAPARALALLTGAVSLALGAAVALGTRGVPAARPSLGLRLVATRAEVALGWVALLLGGVALAGEADRAAWPLPVHPAGTDVVIEGRVLDTTAIDAAPASVTFEARRVRVGESEAACRAVVTLRWHDDVIPPRWILPGLWLECAGRFRPPEDARNPGAGAPGRWLERSGIAGTVAVDPLSIAAPPDPPERGASPGAALRDRLARIFAASLSPPVAALARGMLLGDRSGIDPVVERSFRAGGTIHILSISGLHVCIIAGFLAAIAAMLRLAAGPAAALELAALWGYVALVGAPASAARSAILWTALRSGRLLGQSVRPFAAWGLAGLSLHLLDPGSVSDPGFQLSFLAVLGLGGAGSLGRLPAAARPARAGVPGKIDRWLAGAWSLFAQSAGATAGTTGLQSRLFGAVPLIGLALNLAVIPLCTLFMAEAMLLVALAATPLTPLVSAASGATDASGLLLLTLNARAAPLLAPWMVPRLPSMIVLVVAAMGLLAAWGRAEAARSGRATGASAMRWAIVAIALSVAAPLVPAPAPPGDASTDTIVLALDVGQGDATWVGLPGGRSLLVDAGPADDARDSGERVVEPALRAEGRGPLDAAILSHAHADHFGGFAWLAARGWLSRWVENGSDRRGAWRRPIEMALRLRRGARIAVERDTSIALGRDGRRERDRAASRPDSIRIFHGWDRAGENDRSIAALVGRVPRPILFAGDLETAGEAALLPRLAPVGVLKAPHHGSRTSSGGEWVARLRPRIVLISCGEGNRFGHPDSTVVDRYRRAGASVWRTDQEGAIRVTLRDRGAWVSTRRHPAPAFVTWERERPEAASATSPSERP